MRKHTTPRDSDITRPDWLDDIMPADMSSWLPGKGMPYGASRLTAKVRSSAQGPVASGTIDAKPGQFQPPIWMGGDGRPRGGKRDAKAAERKTAGADRLARLMSGEMGYGVDNLDTLKAGCLTPEARIEALVDMVKVMDRRLENLETDAFVDPVFRPHIRQDLLGRRDQLVADLMGIVRDLPNVSPFLEKPQAVKPRTVEAPVVSFERCPKCNRLVNPPKGVFGCMCK